MADEEMVHQKISGVKDRQKGSISQVRAFESVPGREGEPLQVGKTMHKSVSGQMGEPGRQQDSVPEIVPAPKKDPLREWAAGHIREVRAFFLLFYSVGVAGLFFPVTRDLFRDLITPALLLSWGALMVYQPALRSRRVLLFFLFVWATGFLVEMAGVNTGKIFGNYQYGSGLGWKINGTPLMIGINWLLLTLFFADLVERTTIRGWGSPFLAALGMIMYDLLLEQAAPELDMWHWAHGTIPLQNYFSWFLLALFFQLFLKVFRIPVRNPLAPILLLCQFLFFLVLVILFKFTP